MTKEQLQSQIDKLKKSTNTETLKNRVFNYGQQMLEYKRQKNGEKYKQAKEQRDAAQKELDDYNDKYKKLLDQLKSIDELDKVKKDLDKATKERDFYVKSGQVLPAEVQRKYNELSKKAKDLGLTVEKPKAAEVAARIEMPGGAGAPTTVTATGTQVGMKDVIKTGTLRTPLPKKPSGKAVSGAFNPAAVRQGEEASMVGITPTGDVFAQAQSMYGDIDEIFKTNDELKALLAKAVTGKWEESRFLNELENTNWFKTNAGPIRQRGFYKRQYDSLVEAIKIDDPNYQSRIDELNRTSEYGRGLENAIENVTAEWTSQYGTPTAEDLTTIKAIATELYQYANETDTTKIRNFVLAKPKRFSSTTILGGAAGANLADLKSIAAANGLDLERDFGTSIQTWLDRISKGESIETIKSLIRSTAKTTWGVNDKVAGLLDQGVDLSTIYSPFKTRMANLLEIAPETISFADLASKGVIGGKEEKNLYDFEKELRRDPRWQYTKNAREDMSSTALDLLRNFGFQG